MTQIDPQEALRILCGVWLIPHAVLKLKNFALAQQTFANVGLKPGKLFLVVTVAMEFLAAAGLILNIYPQAAAAMTVFVLMGASYAVLRMHGWNWRWNKSGPEYMVFWSIACILSVI